MAGKLRLLMLEDSRADAALVLAELRRSGFELESTVCDTEEAFRKHLSPELDIILSDFNMPQFSAPRAIEIVRELGLDVPLIVVSGSVGEDVAIEMVKMGAADYLLKDRLARLGSAVSQTLEQRKLRKEKLRADLELRRSREFMQRVMDASPATIFVLNLARRNPIFVSRSIVDLLGITPDQAIASDGDFLPSRVHSDDLRTLEAMLQKFADSAQDQVIESEFRVRHDNGEWRTIRSWGTVFTRDDHGRPADIVGMLQDVSERQRLQEQLRQSQKMQAVGQLAGGIAHDFNNILTVILGYSEMLLAQLPRNDLWEIINEINESGRRASSLTGQLLAFSRKQVLEPRTVDLNQTIQNITSMLSRLIGEDVHLATVLDPAIEHVRVDPGQLEQIIINLAVNARDAMPGGGNLTIETQQAELSEEYCGDQQDCTPGSYVMMSISDTGSGMPREVSQKIFEPFFTTKGVGKGTGLGLSTVHGIVKQSGGHITVYSEVGVGTTFKVYFPIALDGERAASSKRLTADAKNGQETILVVEDDEKVRKLTRSILASLGYKVLLAANGEEALVEIARQQAPIQLLLTDLVMPNMSGSQLAVALRERNPSLKTVFMSGYTDDAVIRNGLVEANTIFVQKPFTSAELAQKVRKALDI